MRDGPGRPYSDVTIGVLAAIETPRTAREVAAILQLNIAHTSKTLHTLLRREQADIVDTRRMPGVNKPVNVYQARAADAPAPGVALFGAFHRVVAGGRAAAE